MSFAAFRELRGTLLVSHLFEFCNDHVLAMLGPRIVRAGAWSTGRLPSGWPGLASGFQELDLDLVQTLDGCGQDVMVGSFQCGLDRGDSGIRLLLIGRG